MELSDYEETCTSEMAYDASQNYSAPCEKEEMELSDYGETCTSEMAYDASQNYSARCEKEEMALFLRGNNPRAVKEAFLRLLMENYPRAVKEEFCRLLMEEFRRFLMEVYDRELISTSKNDLLKKATTIAEKTNDLFKMVTTEVRITNVLRQQVYKLKESLEKSIDEIKLSKKTIDEIEVCEYRQALNIADACDQVLYCILVSMESRMKLFIVLLAVLLLGNKNDCKRLARPERGKISCITVYLLGNDGAHSYNGNGIRFTKTIKYVRLTDDELVDQLGHGKPPMDVRLREPTDREIAKIARKIGREYVSLAPLLGFTKAELDHFREDHRFTEHRVFEMLFKWRETKESNATIEKLADALEELGINADIIYSSLD